MKTVVAAILAGCLLAGCAERDPSQAWRIEELGTRAEFRDVFFLDEQRGWIVGGAHDIEGGILGSTTDGGRTWRFRSALAQPSRRASSFHLNGVWFLDERTGIIVGDGFQILRTLDGGEHWHRVVPAHRVSAHLLEVQFVDAQAGWAVGAGGLLRTLDGGATWHAPHAGDIRGRAIHFLDRNRGWLVGPTGRIRSTTDGGETWSTTDGSHGSGKNDLWGLDFADDLNGWAVGEFGIVLHTADGGKTWQRQASGVVDLLMDVDFIDASHGWIVGFERQTGTSPVLWTTDGGRTWVEQARIPTEATRSLFALDRHNAWAVGSQQRRGPDDGSQKLLRYEAPISGL